MNRAKSLRHRQRRRIDLHVEGMGDFEVESIRGSGPIESFYHKKIFSRVNKETRFSLIVPAEAILWAGPYLSDLAHHLGAKNGQSWSLQRMAHSWKSAASHLSLRESKNCGSLERRRTRKSGHNGCRKARSGSRTLPDMTSQTPDR